MEEYCICGHIKDIHVPFNVLCGGCMDFRDEFVEESIRKSRHEFQLDNLRFVEDEAKRRNLIN